MPDITSHNLVEEVDKAAAEVAEVLVFEATTAQLAENTDAINTTDKFRGKQVLNTTTGILVYANGPAAGDTWKKVSDGTVAHTPA